MTLAAVNGPELCVLSGTPASIEAVEKIFSPEKVLQARRLHVSHAFHSAMIEPLLPSFVEMVGENSTSAGQQFRFCQTSAATGLRQSEATDPNYWGKHLRGTVRFGEG